MNGYKYGRSQHLTTVICAKIIVGVLSNGYKYSIDNNSTFISAGGTAGYCMIKAPERFQIILFIIFKLYLNSKYLEWIACSMVRFSEADMLLEEQKFLKNYLSLKLISIMNLKKLLHDQIASLQEVLIQLQGQIDQNAGNQRELIPLKRQFDNKKTELDEALKSLFNLGEDDNLIPLISELYATH